MYRTTALGQFPKACARGASPHHASHSAGRNFQGVEGHRTQLRTACSGERKAARPFAHNVDVLAWVAWLVGGEKATWSLASSRLERLPRREPSFSVLFSEAGFCAEKGEKALL